MLNPIHGFAKVSGSLSRRLLVWSTVTLLGETAFKIHQVILPALLYCPRILYFCLDIYLLSLRGL